MLVTVNHREYLLLLQKKTHTDSSRIGFLQPLIEAITTDWLDSLKGAKLAALLFILNRTVLVGKAAQVIPFSEFDKGVVEGQNKLCAPVGYSKNTVAAALKELESEGFLIVYRTLSGPAGVENEPRIFEIDCKKVLANRPESDPTGFSSRGGGSKDWMPPNISIKDTKRDSEEEINLFSPSPAGLRDQGKGVVMFGRKKTAAPATPKGGYESAEAAIAAINGKHSATQARRITSAAARPASQMTKEECQSILDKHTKALDLGYRLMVTQREFGFLKKRLAENGPKDFSDYARWVITYWGNIVAQNRRAITRDREKIVKAKPLPDAISFSDFTYRYPYLFKCYQSHLAGRAIDAVLEDPKDKTIKALTEKLKQAEQRAVSLQRVRRPLVSSAPSRPAPRPAPLPRTPRPAVDLDDDVQFGKWDDK